MRSVGVVVHVDVARVGAVSSFTGRRRIVAWTLGVLAVLAVWYGLRVGWLTMWAEEGDVPPTAAVSLPSGATIVSEDRACGSGGCWTVLLVEPPDGQSAEALAAMIGATPYLHIGGNFWDPRPITVGAEPDGQMLELTIGY